MNINIHSKVEKEDKPLTRADVERFLHEAGSSDKLNLSGRNLEKINLAHFSLWGADLRDADLTNADLRDADLSGADLSGADLSGADLSGAIGLVEPKAATAESTSTFRIRIMEDPLTPRNLTSILSAITDLSTKCWLIGNG